MWAAESHSSGVLQVFLPPNYDSGEGWLTKEAWLEEGEGYISEHRASNRYWATPAAKDEEVEEEQGV